MLTQEQANREAQATCYAYGREDGDPSVARRVSPRAFAARVVSLEAHWGQYHEIYAAMLAGVAEWTI